jgi:hypothetical protein
MAVVIGTQEYLSSKNVRWINVPAPVGFIKASNIGIRMAEGEFRCSS